MFQGILNPRVITGWLVIAMAFIAVQSTFVSACLAISVLIVDRMCDDYCYHVGCSHQLANTMGMVGGLGGDIPFVCFFISSSNYKLRNVLVSSSLLGLLLKKGFGIHV